MQETTFRKGARVEAVSRITEPHFNGRRVHVHARRGDTGSILGAGPDAGWWNVAWDASKTITVCYVDEIRALNGVA